MVIHIDLIQTVDIKVVTMVAVEMDTAEIIAVDSKVDADISDKK
jgi:hypothetical protein